MVFILILIPYNIVYRQMVEKCLVVMLNYPVDGAKPSRSQGSKISPKNFAALLVTNTAFEIDDCKIIISL